MTKVHKITLFFLLILLIILYVLWNEKKQSNQTPTQAIKIEPVKISPIIVAEESTSNKLPNEEPLAKKTYSNESSENILSKLEIAAESSKSNHIQTKEEEHNEVLENLQRRVKQQELNKTKIEVLTQIKKATTPQKVVVNEKQQEENKKVPKQKVVNKPKHDKTKETHVKVAKKNTVPRETPTPKKIVQKSVTPVEPVIASNKTPQIMHVPLATKAKETQIHTKPNSSKNLSREAEVALYKSQYADTLEVVSISKSFEIEEVDNNLPDSHYFEALETTKNTKSNEELKFVKTLGVVDVSNQYESNFSIPEKEEVAKEGVVHLSNASLETEELKKLEFVETLSVVEVSEDFETLQADTYLNK